MKGPKKPFLPTTLWLVIKHGLFAFGAVVAGAVMWQRSWAPSRSGSARPS